MPLPQTQHTQPTRPAQATNTLRQPLEYRPRVSEWLATTQELFNQVAAFYWDVLVGRAGRASRCPRSVGQGGAHHAGAAHPRDGGPSSSYHAP